MRHGKRINHLGRTTPHRKAMLSNMASSLILHKRINTTVAKAKALRKYVEPLITKAKDDTTHSRRVVFSYLQNKESVSELFNDVASRVASRPGGYTRIIKLTGRLGDNAEMCMMELVDYNELLLEEAEKSTTRKRRTRRGGRSKSSSDSEETSSAKPKQEKSQEAAPKAKQAEPETSAEVVEEKPAEKAETQAEAPTEEPTAEEDTKEEESAEAKAAEEQPEEDKKDDSEKSENDEDEKKS